MNRPEDPRFSPERTGRLTPPGSIDIKELDKAAVLAALYNGSKPQGAGFITYNPIPMDIEEARSLLKRSQDFDYLKGRVMKVDLSGDELDPRLYDRDNGENAARSLIDILRETGDPNNPDIRSRHISKTRKSEQRTREIIHEDLSEFRNEGGITVLHLGIDDLASSISPKLKEAREFLSREDSEKS